MASFRAHNHLASMKNSTMAYRTWKGSRVALTKGTPRWKYIRTLNFQWRVKRVEEFPVSGLTGWPGPGLDILSPHEDGRILRHQERGQVEVQRHQDGAESIRKCWSVLKLLLHVT